MASRDELAAFLESVERRAFRQAAFAVRNDDVALDLVQDAMLRLAERYGDKPVAELPLLFHRILQNIVHDHFRRQKVRNAWVSLFSALRAPGQEDGDLLETLAAADGTIEAEGAAEQYEREQLLAIIEEAVQALPQRQREAFLLRYWEDMDVAETATVMGCSEGSVKTHCSRATRALALALRARGITP
ncbi:MAG: RNA polymerase sigma factor [Burkholderiales bacterium]|nr:MAG: RNA polymerase sigma factor [Burkholderiales bacterium]